MDASVRAAIERILRAAGPEELDGEVRALRTAADAGRLHESLEVLLAIASTVREKLALENEVAAAARFDRETGLPNRRAFDERLDLELRRSARSRKSFALALLGLEALPSALRPVASAIQTHARGADFAARESDGRFAVLLLDVDRSSVRTVGERLVTAVRRTAIQTPAFNVRAGVALSFPVDNAESIIERAEAALSEAEQRTGSSADGVCFT